MYEFVVEKQTSNICVIDTVQNSQTQKLTEIVSLI